MIIIFTLNIIKIFPLEEKSLDPLVGIEIKTGY